MIVAIFTQNDRGVVAAEAKAVGERGFDRGRPAAVGRIVQVAVRIGHLVIDRRRYEVGLQGLDAD